MKITKIDAKSPAERAGFQLGDTIKSINGHNIEDVLDYKFYTYEKKLDVTVEDECGGERVLKLHKHEGEDIGLEFESYLMDKTRSCSNHCIFCFIDQLPKGMRKSMYVKDDDMRLSFLLGNYITLTNLSEHDIDRICEMRISPINVSVHATDPIVREKMLRNKNAGKCLEIMRRFSEARISMQCQIVACPGVNDGKVLEKTLDDLAELFPAVSSVSIVPVGVTGHRKGLYPLEPVSVEDARNIISVVDRFAEKCMDKWYTRLAFCSDEMYLRANLPIPDYDYYEEFAQLENGVGLMALFEHELKEELEKNEKMKIPEKFSIATGVSAAPFMKKMLDFALNKCDNYIDKSQYKVHAIKNRFFGETIDVAGLVVGRDIIEQLRGEELGERLYVPTVMLRYSGDMFLDDVTLHDLEEALKVKVVPLDIDGAGFVRTIFY